jgi:hypothetical protein
MRRIYAGLMAWNLALLAATGILGALVRADLASASAHRLAGLFTAVFGCLVHSLLIIHFIGSMKWIQQSGPTAGLTDLETRSLRRAWVKGPMFPVLLLAMVATVATGMAGGRASGALQALHAALAVLLLPINAWAFLLARRGIDEARERMRRIGRLAEERVARGLVRAEETAALLPESGRAGGKVFLFLAGNVWVLFVYLRYVLRHTDEAVWPYGVASAVLLLVGLGMLRSAGDRGTADGTKVL